MASSRFSIRAIIRNLFIAVVIAVTIAINMILFYVFAWRPFDIIFHRPEMTYMNYQTRTTLAEISYLLSYLLIFTSSILLLLKLFLDKKISIIAVIISYALVGVLMYSNSFYPRLNQQYFRNGYYYLEQAWSDKKNKSTKYMVWKSSKRGEIKNQDIHWILDTAYTKPW